MADNKNKGGFLGGLGYVGASILAGIGNIGEGAIDAILAPLADLTGNHEFAESLFKKNYVGDWYSDVTEDYNPGGFMEFLGNVGHGLGQSAYLFIPYAGAPIFFSGVMSQGISSAAAQTGDVGIKEAAYGLTTGAVEAGLEYVGGAAAKGAKAIFTNGAKGAVKSSVRKGLVKQVLSDAASEFAEEAMSEVIDVGLQRAYGINPNAELSLKDVLYAGAVGAVSGGVTTTAVQVGLSSKNASRGAKIIKNGNSQTLVNTATSVADRLAANGTNWDNASDWAVALRGQVDAYNKLSNEAKTGLRGQTILGEMQASLYFAETQETFNLVQKNIENASAQDRAAWAEYINRTVERSRRNNRDYTADDIAKNVDNVAWQLAIYKYVPAVFNLDAAVAEADAAQEAEIARVIAKEGGEVARGASDVEATPSSPAMAGASPQGEALGAVPVGAVQYSIERTKDMNWEDQLKNPRRNDTFVVEKNTPSYLTERGISDRPLAIPQSVVTKAKSGKDESHSISDSNISKLQSGIENAVAVIDDKARNSFIVVTNLNENGKPIIVSFAKDATFDGDVVHQATSIHARQNFEAYISKFNESNIKILNKNEFDNLSRKSTHDDARVQESDKLTNKSISQPEGKVNPESQENVSKSETDEKGKNSRSEAVEEKVEETGESPSSVADATASPQGEGLTKTNGKGEVVNNTNFYRKYRAQIRKWDKKTIGFSFVLGNTSSALLKAKIPQAQIRLDASKVKKAIEKHDGMSIEVFEKLTDIIENPIVVVDSKTVEGRKVIIGDVVDENGKTVVLALELSPTSRSGNVLTGIIKVATAQGRSHIQSLLSGNILYVDQNEKRVQQWLNANRLQLPLRSSTVNPDNSIPQNKTVVNSRDKKYDLSSNDGSHEETSEASPSSVADATASPQGEASGEVDLDRAKRDAERMIEWEKKNAPTAEELNVAREYVKGFDNLYSDRQLAIVRMIRSAKGVDANIVKGVANLMAITNRKGEVLAPDLEFRFAEFGADSGKRGIKTEVGGKTVIVLNVNAKYKNTIRGSIAHEIVHYLENRKGYEALAEFAMKHAKAEKVAEVRETYKDFYKGENAEAKIEGEVVASVVAEMLNSEKFLKRYAQMGEESGSVVKRIAKFVKGIATALKEKDGKAEAVAREMMTLVDKALGSEVAGEKSGTKYSVIQKDGVYYSPTDEEIIKNHPSINGVIINDAEYSEGHTLPDDEYKAYRKAQTEKAEKAVGTYTNKDTSYSDEYGLITAEFKTPAIRKGKSYGGIALYDILPYVPQIFENAVVVNTKPDSKSNTNIKGIVNLVGCAILNDKYVAVVKLNVKEYANDEAKIYDNRVIEIEELTVVDRVGHREVKTSSDSTSSAVSSKYIIAKFREFVKNNDEKKSLTNSDIRDSTEQYDLDPEAVAKANEKLIKENERLKRNVKEERSLREKMAREEANAAKAEAARRYTKKEVAPVISEIESLTDEQVKSIAKGFELEGMSGAQKERIISDIYIALHEASAEGEAGPGSVAVKALATKMAWEMIDSARIKGQDGKWYHFNDIYDEFSVQTLADEYTQVLYNAFSNMGEHTRYSYFLAEKRAMDEKFKRERLMDEKVHKLSREVAYQGKRLRKLVEQQKRDMEDAGIIKVTKALASVVDAKGNIRIGAVDDAIAEADRFYSMESAKLDSETKEQLLEGVNLTDFALEGNNALKFMLDEFKRLRSRVDERTGKERRGGFLDADEMRMLGGLLMGLRVTIERYNKAYINGHWIDIDKASNDVVTDVSEFASLEKVAKTKVGELFNTALKAIKQSYFYNVLSPETVIDSLEGFKTGGLLKTLYHDIRVHKQRSEHMAVRMKKPFAEFLDAKGEIEVEVSGEDFNDRIEESRQKGKKITPDMSDDERYEILKNKKIKNIPTVKELSSNSTDGVTDWDDIDKLTGKEKRTVIQKIASEFGVFKGYENEDVEIAFDFSNSNFKESYGKQKRHFQSFAKLFSVFDEVVENAVGIEVHNRNADGYKPDPSLKNVYVLMSAFEDGGNIIPVKLEVKEFNDKQNTLYVAVTLEAIKKAEVSTERTSEKEVAYSARSASAEVWKSGSSEKEVAQSSRSATISISQLFEKINTKDESFLKYVPDGFLNGEQIEAKRRALDKDAEKYGTKKGTPQLIDANAPTRTSENDFVVVPKNIIHQSKENVNKKNSTIKVNPTWKDEKGHKHSYRDKLVKKTVSVCGHEITLGEAVYLYMLTKRRHAHAGLKKGGFITYDENNQQKLKFRIEDVEAARAEIFGQLDAADKVFLNMAEDFFNITASEIKRNADMEIFGYTNNEDGYYVPIIRDRYSRMMGVTDARQSISSIITVYNPSFTQKTVHNAKALEGKSIMDIICDHADALADYSELYLPLKSFDRIYNRGVVINGEVTSLREVLQNKVWSGTDRYLRDLFADIQGQNRKSDNVVDSLVGKLRSAWVNSVLGFNLKVVATQTTSFVAANQVIEAKYLMPAMKKFFGNQSELGARADEYSDIIEARSFEMGALRAQGNIDKVTEWSSKSGFMINLMDRRVCLAIFHAAELKAEARGAGAVGTPQNARAAAKIADEAIYTTQAMTSASERSALQRSKSEIARTLSMFTSDSVKNLSHFVGNIMKYQAHRARAKSDLASKAQYEAELKKDARAIRRSAKTLIATGVMLGLITQAFKYLYAKEEEEPEDKAKDLVTDIASSTLNILPGISDIIDKFFFNYDLSLNVFDVVNDAIEDTANLFNMAGKAMSGEYVSTQNVYKNVFNFLKTVGVMFGAPTAPVERTLSGLVRRFIPSAAYSYDSIFSTPSYTSDLKAAVEDGDEALAEHILSTLYKNEATGVYSSDELEEIARLYGLTDENGKHYNVLPQKIGTEINGAVLSRDQRKQFEGIYSQASEKVNELIRSEYYQDLTDEQRAKAIRNLYALYYNRASAEVAGAEWSNAQAYSRLTDNYSALFASQAYKSGLAAYKTALGKEVSVKDQFVSYAQNLGLSEADLLVVMYANGYRDAATKARLIAYINSLSISEEEKAQIAKRLGFAVENGRVIEKEE